MVGVLNGEKGKAFVVVAFLLCGVFGGLVVEQGLGFYTPYQGIGTGTAGMGSFSLYNVVNLTIPDGYQAHIVAVSGYVKNDSATGCHSRFGLFSLAGLPLVTTAEYDIVATGWVTETLDYYVLSGDYLVGVSLDGANSRAYLDESVSGVVGYFQAVYPFSSAPSFTGWNGNRLSLYLTYEVVPLETVDNSVWLGVGVSFGLIAISLLLALKSRSWAVNFLFGLSTVGFLGWEFANASMELFGGWLLFMVLVGAVLVLVKGAVLVRASGV